MVGPQTPERPAATVRVGIGRDPVSIDPRHLADDEGEFIVRALFDGLVRLGPDGVVVPASADRWDVEADGLTYRFHLGDGRFHDGEPVTARHHADALLAVFDPDRAPRFRDDLLRALRGADVPSRPAPVTGSSPVTPSDDAVPRDVPAEILAAGGIEVVGPRELVVRLSRPDPLLLHQLTDSVLVPLPAAAHLDPADFAQAPIGNGPFRMLGPREPGAFIRLAADPEHARAPRIDGLVLQVYAGDQDRQQRWEDLLSGRLHVTGIPEGLRVEAAERFGRPAPGSSGSGLHDATSASLYAYAFALDVPPFDDVRLRRAISAAIDRAGLAAEVRSANVEPADTILPPTLGGRADPCAHCVHDPFLARELFEDWVADREEQDFPVPLTLTYPSGSGHAAIAERIAADLERVLDVSVRLQSRELAGLVRGVTAGEAPLFRYALRASFGGRAAATAMLDPAFRPGSLENWVRWERPGTTELLDRLAETLDPEIARFVEAELLEAAAVIPLLWTRHDLVVHPDVVGFRLDPTGHWWPELISLR